MANITNTDSRGGSGLAVLLLWLAGLGAAMQFAKMSVFFLDLRAAYEGSEALLGLLVSLISAMGVVFGVVAGLLVARFGHRQILLISLGLGAAISFLQALPMPLWLLLASRVVEGAPHLGIVVAAPTLIAAISTDRWRPAAMTLWGSFFGVAFALAALIGPSIVASGGLPLLFASHGSWMVACAVLLMIVLPRLDMSAPEKLTLPDVLRRHVSIYRSAFISAPAWGWLFYTLTFVAGLTALPQFLSPEGANLFLAAAPIASIVFSLTMGVALLRYTSAVGVIVIGFVGALVVAATFLIFPGSPWPPVALFCVLGLVQGASFAAIPQINQTDHDRALATGALAQTGNIGNLIGTPLLLMAASATGLTGVVGFLSFAYICGLAVHLALAQMRRATEKSLI
ncbi:MAG: MFS transporter [Pseudomonadota bacterium]